MPKIGVVLSGCGVYDGSEIHEATLTLLHLVKHGADVVFLAPDMPQTDVIDHQTGNPVKEQRNVLTEAARIARGKVTPIDQITFKDLDALIFPGGFGAAKNLSEFALVGDPTQSDIHPGVKRLVQNMFEAKKPMGFVCIAPASVAAVALRDKDIKLTIGNDEGTNQAIDSLGNHAVNAAVDDIVIDDENNVVSTPAYMLANNIVEAEGGIEKLVAEVVKRAS